MFLKITILIIASFLVLFLITYFIIRAWMVNDFRRSWQNDLKADPDALRVFNQRAPSYSKMLWSFKQLKDSNWYDKELIVARIMQTTSPENRAALKKWIANGGSAERKTKLKPLQ